MIYILRSGGKIVANNCFLFPPGVDRIYKAMTSYIKSISKRNEGDDKEKNLPIASLGGSMVSHGEDFDAYSEYGRCLTSKPSFFIPGFDLGPTTDGYFSVRTDRRAGRTCPGTIHRTGERQLAGVPRAVHDPNERLPGKLSMRGRLF